MTNLNSPGKLMLSRNSQSCEQPTDGEQSMEKMLCLDLLANLFSYNYWQMGEAEGI